jgi:carboxypeptidase C (cathepsin A)
MAYMLFAYDNYYPAGGMNDWQATFDSMDEFHNSDVSLDYDNFQIFDTYNGNKSNLSMWRKLEELDDVLPTKYEQEFKKKTLENFVSDFIYEG